MPAKPDIYIKRSYERRDERDLPVSEPLCESRGFDAYVLLGEPGSGKTEAFRHEADACGGLYRKARDFTLVQAAEIAGDRIVFIDGLDERRAMGGSAHPPLEDIRLHLDALGRPRFRLSCREADWLGDNDREALSMVAPSRRIEVLRLEPLSKDGILALLVHCDVPDPGDFYSKAQAHRLDAALGNPQVLKLLAAAMASGDWPTSKAEIFERACNELARDKNRVHQTATPSRPPRDAIVEAAGYLDAILLLSGKESFTRIDDPSDPSIVPLSELARTGLPLVEAMGSNLFRASSDFARTYLHRSVAEYLGGGYIAGQIERHGLPAERIVAACVGDDGGIAPDLRGLCAWICARSPKARLTLIDRDPLGVVLYGDVATMPRADKEQIFLALKREANRYPGFRKDDWTAEPFGGLSTADMLPSLEAYLRAPIVSDGDQAFVDCVLDAIANGERLGSLEPLLVQLAQTDALWPSVRKSAIAAIARVSSTTESLLKLVDDIHSGTVVDRDDELLGSLLIRLYGEREIPVTKVLDYLRTPKEKNLIGTYWQFWSPTLVQSTAIEDLPALMADLGTRRKALAEFWEQQHIARNLAGEALVRTLEHYGDSASDEQVYEWLDAGLDHWGNESIDLDELKLVRAWISARPARYKAIAERPIEACRTAADVDMCLRRVRSRLFDAAEPADIVDWYLTKSSVEAQPDISQFYFHLAVAGLHRRERSELLSDASLDLLDSWVARFPKMARWREDATSYPINHWRREEHQQSTKRKTGEVEDKRKIVAAFRAEIGNIASGVARPRLMFELSEIYEGRRIEGRGNTPRERLKNFFDEDPALVDASLSGLERVVLRNDLPSAEDAIALHLKRKFHYIRSAALVGMERRFKKDPARALDLPDRTLRALCAYRLTALLGESPAWYEALAAAQPALVAAVLIESCSRGMAARQEHVDGLSSLGYDPEMKAVAAIAVPKLLAGFPSRAKAEHLKSWLDPLLRGMLMYVRRDEAVDLVQQKQDSGLSPPQRLYWLASGLLLDAPRYFDDLVVFVGNNQRRREQLGNFLGRHAPDLSPMIERLPDEALAYLVELLGPGSSDDLLQGLRRRGALNEASKVVRLAIRVLEQRQAETTPRLLERLIELPSIRNWQYTLRSALHTVRNARRAASLVALTPVQVSRMIANDVPANAADLSAIVVAHLRDLATKIQRGSTNDYKQYWNLESSKPRIENDCRDALLSQLSERLGGMGEVGIPAAKEGHVAHEQRADIIVSYGGVRGFCIPIEVKRESYRKDGNTIWTALRSQLIERYAAYPLAHGHGIYLVFWFGGADLPASPFGVKPRTAAELEAQLRSLLLPEDQRIEIVVMDCSLPTAGS